MRRPSEALVVDASILIAMVRGRGSQALTLASKHHRLLVTDVGVEEARKRVEFGMKAPERIPALHSAIALMSRIAVDSLSSEGADVFLRDAVASRNGSVEDAHILACAWAFDADIWSFDRDFAGTGVASWSTANLMRALEQAW